jgi:hypothetical protein
MPYFPDLSEYEHLPSQILRAGQRNVGWLGKGNRFATEQPTDRFLDRLWDYCLWSFNQTRGRHLCEFCVGEMPRITERSGHQLLLGSAEIRVISNSGEIFASPNLVYHYIAAHNYHPPQVFLDAIISGPRPTSQVYLDALSAIGLKSSPTLKPRTVNRPM